MGKVIGRNPRYRRRRMLACVDPPTPPPCTPTYDWPTHKLFKYEYPSCRPGCMGSDSGAHVNQIPGAVYKVAGKCYKAVTNCWGCLKNPTSHPTELRPISCTYSGPYEYPSCRPGCMGSDNGAHVNQIPGAVYKVAGKCYKAVTNCWGCLENPTSHPTELLPTSCPVKTCK